MFGWKAKTEREKQGLLFRSELKHTINRSDYLALKQRLNAVAQRDTHAEDNGAYHIRSLYFDSPDDKALREKLDGINQREKFRIRYYNWDPSYIRLEKKSKRNGVGNKQYAPMTQEQCEQLIAGEQASSSGGTVWKDKIPTTPPQNHRGLYPRGLFVSCRKCAGHS